MSKIILAVDPGLNTGYALSTGKYGKWDFSRSPGDPVGMPAVLFYKRLTLFCAQNEVEVLAYEKLFHMAGKRAGRGVQYGWETIVLMVAAELGMELVSYWPTNIKKRFTGSGKADKDDMRAKLAADHGIDVDDHNTVDALILLFLARQDCQ